MALMLQFAVLLARRLGRPEPTAGSYQPSGGWSHQARLYQECQWYAVERAMQSCAF